MLFNHSCDAEVAFVMLHCRLTELNAVRQVFNVCSSPVVQSAWDQGQTLSVHGLAYAVGDGLLKVSSRHITPVYIIQPDVLIISANH